MDRPRITTSTSTTPPPPTTTTTTTTNYLFTYIEKLRQQKCFPND